MKYRSGFVSNSSSCSFLLVGFILDEKFEVNSAKERFEFMMKEYDNCSDYVRQQLYNIRNLKEEDDNFEDYVNDLWYSDFIPNSDFKIINDLEQGGIEGKTIIGKELNSWDDCDYPDINLSVDDINKIGDEVKERFNIDDCEVKVIVRTKVC